MAERRGLVIGARIASGTVVAGIAAVVVGAIAILPLPRTAAEPRSVTVEPAPADQVRVCPGAVVRLGESSGERTDESFTIGAPTVDAAALDGDLARARLTPAAADAAAGAAPEVLRVPSVDGLALGGAQSQEPDAPDFRGLAAASCGEPTGSAWLVGGATTVGRSTFLLLSNPTEVPARVSLELYGEQGPVSAPGLSGIEVPAGGQRVLSLAGFAPGLASPIVHVTARGGRVVATLQHSVVRGLDAVGVEMVGPGADPAPSLVVPGVRIADSVGTNRASALAGWQDVGPVVRVGVPGDAAATVTVRVVPTGTDGIGTSFVLDVDAGDVVDVPLDAGVQEGGQSPDGEGEEERRGGLGDGLYTVHVDADVPVVAAVRASTALDVAGRDIGFGDLLGAPPSDLAWFSAAPALDGVAVVAVPAGPSPLLSLVNPTAEPAEVELTPLGGGGQPLVVAVPGGGAVGVEIAPGTYRLAGAESISAGVSLAGPGLLAAFVLAPDRPVAGPVVVRPD